MSAVGFGSTLKTHERACKFAMAVAVASRGRDWDQWQVQNKIKMRRDPLGMKMLTNDGRRSAVQEDRLLIHQTHLMQARQAWLQLVASKRSRTERSSSRSKRPRLPLPAHPIASVARSRAHMRGRDSSLLRGSASQKRRVVTPPRRAFRSKSRRGKARSARRHDALSAKAFVSKHGQVRPT